MAIQSPPRDFIHQNGSFFLPFLSPTVTPSHEDSDPYHELLFVPFQPPTKIDLGSCRLGQSTSCKLNIFNPKDEPLTALLVDTPRNCPVQVETIRLPISERLTEGADCHIYHLPPNSSALLCITWAPTLLEDLYLSLTFKWSKFTSKVSLYGKVEDLPVKSRRALFGTDLKASLGVTRNMSSSFRLPLRSVTLNSPGPDKPLLQLHPLITPMPSHTFLDTAADTSTASLPSTRSFIASTPMERNVTRPLIAEQSFANPSAIKRATTLNGRQGANTSVCPAKRALPFSVAGAGKFDSEWAEKQGRAFTHWLNYVLTPPDSSNFSASLPSSEGSPATQRSIVNLTTTLRGSPPLSAPTDAVTEPQYSLTQRKYLSRLRMKSQELAKSAELTSTLYLLHAEVDKARLKIRPEKPVWKDVGLREDLLHTLLSYHPLWLRLGLEAVFSCHVPVSHEMDSRMLKRFLSSHLVTSGDISVKYAHRRVPGLFTKGYEQAIGKHLTFKFFALVLFLDKGKRQRLIDHDPCLFLKRARVKCSREMLLYFSRNFLQGEGDITKHLHNLGYHVSHKQSFLEEFDYKVTNLATDLRDGIRLSRLLELLTQDWTLSDKLRIPATSLTPRLANNKLFLDRFQEMLSFPLSVTNKDLAVGHREKTLSLIWALIFHFRVGVKIDEMLLRREINYIRAKHSIRECCVPYKPFGCEDQGQFDSATLQLLLEWCSVICRVFGLRVTDFTASFQDGRAFCYILHYYHPSLISKHLISGEARPNLELFCEKMSSLGGIPSLPPSSDFHQTGPNEKVVIMYVAYLCAQQLELREEIRAAIVIQRAFKRYLLRSEQALINQVSYDAQLIEFHTQTLAATTIQACFRGTVARAKFWALKKRESLISEMSFQIANSYMSQEIGSVLAEEIQNTIQEQEIRDRDLQHAMDRIRSVISQSSVSLIQSSLREYSNKTKENGIYLREISTQIVSRAVSGAGIALEQEGLHAAKLREAKEQAYNRESIENQAREIVEEILLESLSGVIARRDKAANTIQCWYRAQKTRKNLIQQARYARSLDYKSSDLVSEVLSSSLSSVTRSRTLAATAIQNTFRRFLTATACRRRFLLMRKSVLSIQFSFRRFIEKKGNYDLLSTLASHTVELAMSQSLRTIARNDASITLQSWYRTRLTVKKFHRLHESRSAAATTLQRAYRSRSRAVACRRDYLQLRHASVTIQRCYREFLEAKRGNLQLLEMFASRFVAQSLACSVLIFERERDRAAITIQSYYRTYSCVKNFQRLKRREAAARNIQLGYRNYLLSISARERFLRLKISTLIIQRAFRKYLVRLERYSSALNLLADNFVSQTLSDSLARLTAARLSAALSIQSWYRMVACRRQYNRELLQKKSLALFLQRVYRNSCVTASYRAEFIVLKTSSIIIQRSWRGFNVRRRQNNSFLDRFASSIVQDSLTNSQYSLVGERATAAQCIQAWYREILRERAAIALELMEKQNLENLQTTAQKIVSTALLNSTNIFLESRRRALATARIQAWYRETQKKRAAIALELKRKRHNLENLQTTAQKIVSTALLNSTDICLESHRRIRAALTIQSLYRGHRVRREIQNSSLLNVKRRLSEATHSAEPCQQLRNKIPRYIDVLLNARSLEQKYNILDKLKSAVYVSELCAIKLRREGLDVLYMLVDNNVRSPSIIQRVEKAADVILQLAKWPSISKEVFLHGQSIPIIADVLQKIHATQPSTVRILCRLLIQFCAYPDQVALMHTYHHTSIIKIYKCLMTLKRKYTVGSRRMPRKAKKDLAQSIHELEAVFTHFRYAN